MSRLDPFRPMKPIPISAGKEIAGRYGYDQVVIMARRIANPLPPINTETTRPEGGPESEHITTFGVDKTHCAVAELMGTTLKRIAHWPSEQDREDLDRLLDKLESGTFDYSEYDEDSRAIGALRRLLKGT